MGCAESGASQIEPRSGAQAKITSEPKSKQGVVESNPEVQQEGKVLKPVNITEYMDDLQQTSEQLQQDNAHGINEYQTVRAKIDWENKTIEFSDNYSYTYQNGAYVEVTRRTRVTKLGGVLKEEGGKILAEVKGSYSQFNKQNQKETLNVNKNNVTGSFVIEKTPQGIRINNVVLLEKGVAFQTYFKKPVVMKKM